ncbi:MAG TPA: hypothetical protein VL326_22915 [Kofleriaceae bacterium]|nr:hypothetical protein [Kofleriaceae bacterium]
MRAGIALFLCAACTNEESINLPHGDLLVEGVCSTYETRPYFTSAGDDLYWISPCDETIRSASKQDGSSRVFAANEPLAAMLAVDDTYLYWTRSSSLAAGEIVRAPRAGGVPVVIATAQDQMYGALPQQLVVDETTLYRSKMSEILAMPKDGTAEPGVIATGTGGPFLAVDSEYIYWANMHSVHRQRKGSSTDEELAHVESAIFDPIAYTEHAVFYWWQSHLYKIEKETGGPAKMVLEGAPHGRAFVSDGIEFLYWQSGTTLVRTSEDGIVSPIVQLVERADAIAIDDQRIYWIESEKISSSPR